MYKTIALAVGRRRCFLSVATLVATLLAATESRAQRAVWASERSGGRSTIDTRIGALAIRASIEPSGHGRRVTLVFRNTSDTLVTHVDGRLEVLGRTCASLELVRPISPFAVVVTESICDAPPASTDPNWDLNQPIELVLRLNGSGDASAERVPIGFVRYAGWPTSNDPATAGRLFQMMSAQREPALAPLIEDIRAQALALAGPVSNDSPAYRVAVARAIAHFIVRSGIRYQQFGDAYLGQWPSGGTTSYPAETLAYGWGACDDFAVLAGFLLHSLHVPSLTYSSPGHAANLVVLARWRANRPRPALDPDLRSLAVEGQCGADRCWLVPFDTSTVDATSSVGSLLATSRTWWLRARDARDAHVVLASWSVGGAVPSAHLLGRPWLGAEPNVRIVMPDARPATNADRQIASASSPVLSRRTN